MNNFVYPEFLKSYAWKVYFQALEDAMESSDPFEGTFEHIFCEESLKGKHLQDFDYIELEENLYKVFIDSNMRLAFDGAQVSQDNNYWEYRTSPKRGVLYVRTTSSNPEILESIGSYIDLHKTDVAIQRIFKSPVTNYTTDVMHRKLDSFYLLKWILQRQGFDYEIDLGNTATTEFPVTDMVEVLTPGTRVLYKVTKGSIRTTDTLLINKREYPIRAASKDELVVDINLQPGYYSIVRRQQYAPLSLTPPNSLMLIYLLERSEKAAIQHLLDRESPMRMKANVLYFDVVLLASLQYKGVYSLSSLDSQIFVVAPEKGYHRIDEVRVDWKKGSTVEVWLCSNEVSWTALSEDPEIKVLPETSVINRGQHWRVQQIQFVNTEYNRVFKEFHHNVRFVGVNRNTGDQIVYDFDVIVKKWDPTVAFLNIGEDFLVTDSIRSTRLEMIEPYKDNFAVASAEAYEETKPKKLTVSDELTIKSEEIANIHAHYVINIKDNFDVASSESAKDTTPKKVILDIKDNFDLLEGVSVYEFTVRRLIASDEFSISDGEATRVQSTWAVTVKDNFDLSDSNQSTEQE